MSENGKFEHASLQDSETIQQFLQALIDGFKAGTLSLASDDDNLLLHPPDLLRFKIKAKKRDDKTKIDIKIEWKNPGIGAADDTLRIGH